MLLHNEWVPRGSESKEKQSLWPNIWQISRKLWFTNSKSQRQPTRWNVTQVSGQLHKFGGLGHREQPYWGCFSMLLKENIQVTCPCSAIEQFSRVHWLWWDKCHLAYASDYRLSFKQFYWSASKKILFYLEGNDGQWRWGHVKAQSPPI